MDRSKDIFIDEKKYCINKFSAKIGMWIAIRIFPKVLQFNNGFDLNKIPDLLAQDEFSDLIDYCLLACQRYENAGTAELPMPIMVKKGLWAIKELEYDLPTVLALCVQVLTFNLSTFFTEKSLKVITEGMKDLSLPNTPL